MCPVCLQLTALLSSPAPSSTCADLGSLKLRRAFSIQTSEPFVSVVTTLRGACNYAFTLIAGTNLALVRKSSRTA